MTKSNLGRKRFCWVDMSYHNASLREAKAGSQQNRDQEAGTEAVTTEE